MHDLYQTAGFLACALGVYWAVRELVLNPILAQLRSISTEIAAIRQQLRELELDRKIKEFDPFTRQ